MQFQAGITNAHVVETTFYDLQRCHLLGDEQYFLTAAKGVGDEVSDRLGFASAGRPLNDQITPAGYIEHRKQLGTVGIDDLMRGARIDMLVDVGLIGKRGRLIQEPLAEQFEEAGLRRG